jgi:hypothetical protein
MNTLKAAATLSFVITLVAVGLLCHTYWLLGQITRHPE